MYLEAFNLKRAPFSMTSDPGTLYLSASHREALAGLCYGLLDRKGLLVLLGEVGTGKTTLLARAMERLPVNGMRLAAILNPTLSPAEFIEMVLLSFGVGEIPPSKPQRLRSLQNLLLQFQAEGTIATLMIDEAHNLPPDVIEEVRLLGNLENRAEKLLQIVLSGQSELTERLNRVDMRQFKQRIALRLVLKPLSRLEVADYIHYRWVRAGGADQMPFTPAALEMIAQFSRGIPRVVNAICDNALLIVFGEQGSLVEPRHIRQSCEDLDLIARTSQSASHPSALFEPALAEASPAPSEAEAEKRPFWAKWAGRTRLAS